MPKKQAAIRETEQELFSRQVREKADRKIRAQRRPMRSIWLGFGVTGVIGWSIAIPSILGALLGHWLDVRHPGAHSWTLALLVAGLCLGCFQAWNWVAAQDKAMHEEPKEDMEENHGEQNE
jgi:ATP synthase protein I